MHMRTITLSDPDAVWQAAHAILTQPHAVAIFAKALSLLPTDGHGLAKMHRIRLELCHGLALFSANQMEACLAVLHTAAQRAARHPLPAPTPQPPTAMDTHAGLALLRHTLVGLAALGLTAFPTAGSLLGLVREGRLLPKDKDLDVGVPFGQLQTAANAMPTLGWKPARVTVNAVNFRSFVHTQHPVTLDLLGYEWDATQPCVWGGWWPVGLPREQGRLLKLAPIQLELTSHPWGMHWAVCQPEQLLVQLYGPDWRTPNSAFDGTLETPALCAHTPFTRVWGALRVLEAWLQGQAQLVARRLHILAKLDATDPVVRAFTAPDASPLPLGLPY